MLPDGSALAHTGGAGSDTAVPYPKIPFDLDAYEERVRSGRMRNEEDLTEAIIHGAVRRVRPKMMTVAAAFMGLLPVMWATGAGADVMKRIAAPMVGGLFTSFALELLVYPAIYAIWKWRFEMKSGRAVPQPKMFDRPAAA